VSKRPTLADARNRALRTYRVTLKAGEAGNWELASKLTERVRCVFCARGDCDSCPRPVRVWCGKSPQYAAGSVLSGKDRPSFALRQYRAVIRMLEKLDVTEAKA